MAGPSLQGYDPGLGEGAPPGDGVIPASRSSSARVRLILEAVVGVLQGVSVTGPWLVRLQAGAQTLQGEERPSLNKAVN